MRKTCAILGVVVFACGGCSAAAEPADPVLPQRPPATPLPDGPPPGDAPPADRVESEQSLAPLLPEGATPVGVAVAPEGGQRYVLDETRGLYELTEGGAVLRFDGQAARAADGSALQFTDVVAMGDQRFAITAVNEGFLLNLSTGSFWRYFCYLPPLAGPPAGVDVSTLSLSQQLQLQGVGVSQRTDSVGYDPASGRLYAQPQTFADGAETAVGAELFIFSAAGGEPETWESITDPTFNAGGMVLSESGRPLLGRGSQLFVQNADTGLSVFKDFGEPALDIDIAGMARDTDGTVLILDSRHMRLVNVSF